MVFRVRHEPEHIACRIADPGNIEHGAIGIGRIFSICGTAICADVGQRDLIERLEIG